MNDEREVDDNWTVISEYTRAQAIDDGTLIDVSEMAREAGFSIPVAMTSTVYAEYVKVPAGLEGEQDETGRLWDILWMLHVAIKQGRGEGNCCMFRLYVKQDQKEPQLVRLKSICGPGDHAEPVITIMMPNED